MVLSLRSSKKYPPAVIMPVREMFGVPSDELIRVHPARFTSEPLGLYNSIHSSFGEATVPPQATSLITTSSAPTLVGVGLGVGVSVGVLVGVAVSVGVGVLVGV